MPLHRKQFTHRSFCTQHAFTHSQPLHGEALLPLLDHLRLVFPPSSFIMESLKTSTRPKASTVVAVVGSIVEITVRLSVCAFVCKHRSHTHRWKRVALSCMHFARDDHHCRNVFFNAEPRRTTAFSIGIQVCPIKACPQIHWFFTILPFEIIKHFGVYPIAFIFFPCLHTYVYIVGYPVMHYHGLQCIS